jgi:hypothetical protein
MLKQGIDITGTVKPAIQHKFNFAHIHILQIPQQFTQRGYIGNVSGQGAVLHRHHRTLTKHQRQIQLRQGFTTFVVAITYMPEQFGIRRYAGDVVDQMLAVLVALTLPRQETHNTIVINPGKDLTDTQRSIRSPYARYLLA